MAHVLQCKRDKLLSLLPVRWNVHHSIDHSLTSDHKQSGRKSHGNNESVCSCFFCLGLLWVCPSFKSPIRMNLNSGLCIDLLSLLPPECSFSNDISPIIRNLIVFLWIGAISVCVFFRLLSTSSWSVCFCIWLRFINVISCVHKRRC